MLLTKYGLTMLLVGEMELMAVEIYSQDKGTSKEQKFPGGFAGQDP